MPLFRRKTKLQSAVEAWEARSVVPSQTLYPLINRALDLVLGNEFKTFGSMVFDRSQGIGKTRLKVHTREGLSRVTAEWGASYNDKLGGAMEALTAVRLAPGDPLLEIEVLAERLLSHFAAQAMSEMRRSQAAIEDNMRKLNKHGDEYTAYQRSIFSITKEMVEALRTLHDEHPDLFDALGVSEYNLSRLGFVLPSGNDSHDL